MEQDEWLKNAEVQSRITLNKGRWEVELVFIDTQDPKHVLVQLISDHATEQLAVIHARNLKATAQKDSRGTRRVPRNAYDINPN